MVLTTVNSGVPNAILPVSQFDEETLVVADLLPQDPGKHSFGKSGGDSFPHQGGEAYQIKGTLTYYRRRYDDMKRWNPTKHPGHAAALSVEEVYAGGERLL